jgi:hypothetical protein
MVLDNAYLWIFLVCGVLESQSPTKHKLLVFEIENTVKSILTAREQFVRIYFLLRLSN